MRLSRKDYNKPHRCPGWSGPGWGSTKTDWCKGGRIQMDWVSRWEHFQFHQCKSCGTWTLPLSTRYLDPTYYWVHVRWWYISNLTLWAKRHGWILPPSQPAYVPVRHKPQWVPAELVADAAGNTKPGFECAYELENGRGQCTSNWFEITTDEHVSFVPNPHRTWRYLLPRRAAGTSR